MPDGGMNLKASRQSNVTKIKGLASVMLYDGSSAFNFERVCCVLTAFDRYALLRVSSTAHQSIKFMPIRL